MTLRQACLLAAFGTGLHALFALFTMLAGSPGGWMNLAGGKQQLIVQLSVLTIVFYYLFFVAFYHSGAVKKSPVLKAATIAALVGVAIPVILTGLSQIQPVARFLMSSALLWRLLLAIVAIASLAAQAAFFALFTLHLDPDYDTLKSLGRLLVISILAMMFGIVLAALARNLLPTAAYSWQQGMSNLIGILSLFVYGILTVFLVKLYRENPFDDW